MDMYGNYSIYFLDIFGTFEATFVAYLFGILATVTLGFLSAELIDWLSKEKKTVPTASSDGEQPLEKSERTEKVLADPDAEANA
jgi:hypothetical protein